jgi:hypothetical protein
VIEVKKNMLMREAIRNVLASGDKTTSSVKKSSLKRRVITTESRDDNNNTIVYEKPAAMMNATDAKSLALVVSHTRGVKVAGSTFLVDFASTPIKLAPKTSTPKRE